MLSILIGIQVRICAPDRDSFKHLSSAMGSKETMTESERTPAYDMFQPYPIPPELGQKALRLLLSLAPEHWQHDSRTYIRPINTKSSAGPRVIALGLATNKVSVGHYVTQATMNQPELVQAVVDIGDCHPRKMRFTAVHIIDSYETPPHIDNKNSEVAMVCLLGNFSEGLRYKSRPSIFNA